MAKRRGRFIVFEGPSGSGKSGLAKRLCSRREEYFHPPIHFPDEGNPIGSLINRCLRDGKVLSEELWIELFIAEMHWVQESLIVPKLKEGKIVIADRWFLSTYVYHNLGYDGFKDARLANLITPDLWVLCDASSKEIAFRVRGRDKASHVYSEDCEGKWLAKYREFFQIIPELRKVTLTTDQNIASADLIDTVRYHMALKAPVGRKRG